MFFSGFDFEKKIKLFFESNCVSKLEHRNMDSNEMQHHMKDAGSMFKEYVLLGGKSTFDEYKRKLQLFFFHTLNSHVFGVSSEDYDGNSKDELGYALHKNREEAEDALMRAAGIDHAEVGFIFYSVDSVHPYT